MFLADVVGTVVAPITIPVLENRTLLLLRTLDPAGKPNGKLRVGIDLAQAGVGDRVLVVDEGNAGRQLLEAPEGAVKTVVVGVVDYVTRESGEAQDAVELLYDHRDRKPVANLKD